MPIEKRSKDAANVESLARWVDAARQCRDQIHHLSLKTLAIGDLLEQSFEKNSDTTYYGLGILLQDFADQLSDISMSMDGLCAAHLEKPIYSIRDSASSRAKPANSKN